MKVDLYNQQGEKLKTKATLNPSIFGIEPNKQLLSQYVRVYQANQRQGTAKVKTRAEVSGGGRKPWAQKGTGRARHGSIRSPIWVGGGVAFGPTPREWRLKLPRKMRRRALFVALSQKAQAGKILVVNKLALPEIKTKLMGETLAKLGLSGKVLVVLPEADKSVVLSARNLGQVTVVVASNLNAYDILAAESVVFIKESLKVVEDVFGGGA